MLPSLKLNLRVVVLIYSYLLCSNFTYGSPDNEKQSVRKITREIIPIEQEPLPDTVKSNNPEVKTVTYEPLKWKFIADHQAKDIEQKIKDSNNIENILVDGVGNTRNVSVKNSRNSDIVEIEQEKKNEKEDQTSNFLRQPQQLPPIQIVINEASRNSFLAPELMYPQHRSIDLVTSDGVEKHLYGSRLQSAAPILADQEQLHKYLASQSTDFDPLTPIVFVRQSSVPTFIKSYLSPPIYGQKQKSFVKPIIVNADPSNVEIDEPSIERGVSTNRSDQLNNYPIYNNDETNERNFKVELLEEEDEKDKNKQQEKTDEKQEKQQLVTTPPNNIVINNQGNNNNVWQEPLFGESNKLENNNLSEKKGDEERSSFDKKDKLVNVDEPRIVKKVSIDPEFVFGFSPHFATSYPEKKKLDVGILPQFNDEPSQEWPNVLEP